MIFARIKKTIPTLGLILSGLFAVLSANAGLAQVMLQDIEFVSLSGSQFEIELAFSAVPPMPEVFVINDPTRITMDFTDVTSELAQRRFPLEFSGADSVMILEAQGRTRMVINLNGTTSYTTRVQGNSLFVVVGDETLGTSTGSVLSAAAPSASAQNPNENLRAFSAPALRGNDITGLDFRRGDDNSGQIILDVAKEGVVTTISQNGTRLEVEFTNFAINTDQQVRLDVADFATPVQSVSMYIENNNVMVSAEVTGQYEYLAYQNAGQYFVNVIPVAVSSGGVGSDNAANFSGERISLNFQDIEVRAVLQILADFNNFSLVVGDNVTGNITLRLDNVPWDQALNLVLRSSALDQRLMGNVLYVAPAAEIATFELEALESTQQTDALSPLVTEYFEINYAIASELLILLQGENGSILSERGSAAVDVRTNTLIIQDAASVLSDVKALIARIDIPVRQVLIEARIVNASTSFSKGLGIRWGGAQTFPDSFDQYVLSGSMNTNTNLSNALSAGGVVPSPGFPDALVVDLGLAAASSSIALGYAGNSGLLQLELAALESSGNGEVIAQPKVTTQDQQMARIESGLQVPYQAQAGGTAGGSTTEFVTAALSMQVTPQITPDGRIIMLLDIHQDSVVPGSGGVPAIATNSVNTRVLVNDGDTVVLGGVFREEITTSVSKTPLLGDLPYVGNIFKRTENSETKTELLIFITPSIIKDLL